MAAICDGSHMVARWDSQSDATFMFADAFGDFVWKGLREERVDAKITTINVVITLSCTFFCRTGCCTREGPRGIL